MSEPAPVRIGNDDRNAAQQALDEHMTAGRLDPDEYGDRVARASVARTRAELDALFTDLPEPHGRPAATAVQPRSAPPDAPNALGGRAGMTLVALSPFIALVLFFVFHSWLFFLLVPALGAIVYGGADRGRQRNRRR